MHGVREVPSEIGCSLVDAADGETDAAGHRFAGSFGGVACAPWPPAEAERGSEFGGDEVTFGSGLLGTAKIGERFGVGHIIFEFGETTSILGPCPRVEHVT